MTQIFSKAGPGFNHQAAEEVYKAIIACPDDESAAFMTRAIVYDVMCRDMAHHEDFLTKTYYQDIHKRARQLRLGIAKQYIAKKRAGEDVRDLAKAAVYVEQLSKQYTSEERRENARRQRRAATGRFVRESTHIDYTHARQPRVPRTEFNRFYAATMPENLSPRNQQKYQEAFHQIADLVEPWAHLDNAFVHLYYKNHPPKIVPVMGWDNHLLTDSDETPTGASVSTVGPVSAANVPEGAPDFFTMFGGGRLGANISSTVATPEQWRGSGLNPERLRNYVNAREQPIPPEYISQPGYRLMNRLGAGSELMQQTLGPFAPPKVQAALMAGKYVGQYGPEAQRVLGPTARKTSYRYRGVEKTPDLQLRQAFAAANESDLLRGRSAADKVRALIMPVRGGRGPTENSPVIQYFANRLPKANLNTLQLMSGTVPPSEGVLINSKGQPISQAVGYGDDWYLPFNLKNVGRMRGGSYIRTRTFGGPTTEDVYTALMSGADSLTVVSHNGVYNMQFAHDFKGGRRYNDKAARMVNRYAQLLDAVNSKKVELDALDPSRKDELREEALRTARNRDNAKEVQDRYDALLKAEQVHPKLSKEQDADLKRQVIESHLDTMRTASGEPATRGQLVARMLGQVRSNIAADVRDNPDMLKAQKQYNDIMMENDDELIKANNWGPELEKARQRKLTDIRHEISPLSLNGKGYDLALNALREQFPYYIHQPTYYPWQEGGRDKGYIMPRRVRPREALAGYFDPEVQGHGKIQAHSIGRREPRFWQAEGTSTTTPAVGGVAPPGRTPAASGTTGTATVPRPAAADNLSTAESAASMARHIRDLIQNGNISSRADPSIASRPASQITRLTDPQAEGSSDQMRQIARIGQLTDEDIETRMREPERFYGDVNQAVRNIQTARLFDFNRDELANFTNRGAGPAIKEWPENNPSEYLNDPDAVYRLGGIFEPGRHDPTDISNTFATDEDIQAAGLHQHALGSDELRQAITAKRAELRRRYGDLRRDAQYQYGQYSQEDRNRADRETLGLAKAHALNERHREARRAAENRQREQIAANAPDITVMTPEQATGLAALAQVLPQIQNQPGAPDPLDLWRRLTQTQALPPTERRQNE